MADAYSVSVTVGDTAERHDRREYTPGNADRRLHEKNNVIIDVGNEREWFNDLFADSIVEHNAKQSRKDRMKSLDYYLEIENSKNGEHQFYEYVIQIGNRDNNGVTTSDFDVSEWKKDKENYDIASVLNNSPERLELKAILDEEMGKLQERYPNFRFCCIIGHDDESNGTYHYHVRFAPVGTGYKKGMPKRCALNKALEGMGFKGGEGEYPIHQWVNDVKDHIEQAMNEKGYSRQFMSNEEKHLSVPEFKREMRVREMEAAEATAFDKMVDALEDADAIQAGSNADYAATMAEIQLGRYELQLETQEFFTKARNIQQKINQKADEMAEQEKDLDSQKAYIASRAAEIDEIERDIVQKEIGAKRREDEAEAKNNTADQFLIKARNAFDEICALSEITINEFTTEWLKEHKYKDGTSFHERLMRDWNERTKATQEALQQAEDMKTKFVERPMLTTGRRGPRVGGEISKFLYGQETVHGDYSELGL